jgi:hypothetical protein
MVNSGFGSLADASVDLYPTGLRSQIDELNDQIGRITMMGRLDTVLYNPPVSRSLPLLRCDHRAHLAGSGPDGV